VWDVLVSEVPNPFRLSLSLSLGDRERWPVLAVGAPSESETSVMAEASISTLPEEVDGEKDMVRQSYWKLDTARIDDLQQMIMKSE
jgi:hypothetical protein